MMEILNMWSPAESGQRNALAKVAGPQSTETIEGGRIVGTSCQWMSKPQLTLVETRDKAKEADSELRDTTRTGLNGFAKKASCDALSGLKPSAVLAVSGTVEDVPSQD